MKENERLLLFYEECVKKGYSDMTDPQQALKAKVIATDMELRYGNSVEKLFQKAKAASEEQKVKRAQSRGGKTHSCGGKASTCGVRKGANKVLWQLFDGYCL